MIFSVVKVLDERSSEHFLFLLARYFSPRYAPSKFTRMPCFVGAGRLEGALTYYVSVVVLVCMVSGVCTVQPDG